MGCKNVFQSGSAKNDFPLFVEQFLLMLVGLTDTLIVSYAGEARL